MKQEFKVGLALLATVVALVFGIRFFEDAPLFGGSKTFTTSLSRGDGLASGNVVQVPVHVPVNVCGNTVSIIGLLNPTFGNTCINA